MKFFSKITNALAALVGGRYDKMTNASRPELPKPLFWLADAPLFIDSDQVEGFYDAVARPQSKEGTSVLETTDENVRELKGKLNIEAEVTTTNFAAVLAPFLAFVKPKLTGSGEGEASKQTTTGKKTSIEMHPVETPQSQLEALTLFYLANYAKRIFFADPKAADWRDPQSVRDVPRSLVFLDLPSFEESATNHTPSTKLIPTAAEFENGKIVQIYPTLLAENGERPPKYPEKGTPQVLQTERQKYWQWFDVNYNATRAMVAIEEAASANGKIRWIDYRLPLTNDGETLHLHVCPAGRYDTGVVAYNFVKRGFKHGIRLIGTLKSEPDMNVLAIYEK
jgi:hypothetical protein